MLCAFYASPCRIFHVLLCLTLLLPPPHHEHTYYGHHPHVPAFFVVEACWYTMWLIWSTWYVMSVVNIYRVVILTWASPDMDSVPADHKLHCCKFLHSWQKQHKCCLRQCFPVAHSMMSADHVLCCHLTCNICGEV